MDEAQIEVLAVEYLGRSLAALLIVAVGWLALRFFLVPLRRLLERSRIDPAVVSFLSNSLRSVVGVVILLGILQQFGVTTASLLTLLGAAGLAIALSLQSSLANFASGLLILSFRLVGVGDWIEVGDVSGRVSELLPFHVVLIGLDNQRIVVPNGLLTNGAVRNHSALAERCVQWTLPLTTEDDIATLKESLQRRLEMDPRVLPQPAPHIYLQAWTREGRTLAVSAWVSAADFLPVQQDLLEELAKFVDTARRPATGE